MRVDPNAIYGTYQLLNRQQAQNIENARATAIERGLGAGGGLGLQLQSEARYQAGQQDAQFSSQLTDQFTDLATQQQQAKQAYDAAKYQAELDKIRMALANGNYGGGGSVSTVTAAAAPAATAPGTDGYGNPLPANKLIGGRYMVNPVKTNYTPKAVINTPRDFLNF
jgi:hypothetical protein